MLFSRSTIYLFKDAEDFVETLCIFVGLTITFKDLSDLICFGLYAVYYYSGQP